MIPTHKYLITEEYPNKKNYNTMWDSAKEPIKRFNAIKSLIKASKAEYNASYFCNKHFDVIFEICFESITKFPFPPPFLPLPPLSTFSLFLLFFISPPSFPPSIIPPSFPSFLIIFLLLPIIPSPSLS